MESSSEENDEKPINDEKTIETIGENAIEITRESKIATRKRKFQIPEISVGLIVNILFGLWMMALLLLSKSPLAKEKVPL